MEPARVSGNNTITFVINGISYSVSDDSIPADTTLLVFIREYAKFRGTKAMCHAGDCGACVVSVTFKDKTIAVNSCLVLVLTCD
ncbi:PREDICTED: aldehyde oxidase 2-like, partial [Trachymyrmex cornetzi]|uniref:aldehyde oxidase 2-like n=1 Tax=Trachymyrmex cornetzi TaxID=471704 RepID=UPI00084EDF1D